MNVYWCPCGRESRNFGDQLMPLLLDHLHVEYRWSPPEKADLFGIGSIAHQIPDNFAGVVWSTGMLQKGDRRDLRRARVFALRGKRTVSSVDLNTSEELPLGDGGLLACLLARPQKKTHRLGLIPHYADQDTAAVGQIRQRHPDVLLIDVCASPQQVLDQIASCDVIASSSLHGLVVAESLGIPTVWLEISGGANLLGGRFKFDDYYSAFDCERTPHDLRGDEHPDELIASAANSVALQRLEQLQKDLLESLRAALEAAQSGNVTPTGRARREQQGPLTDGPALHIGGLEKRIWGDVVRLGVEIKGSGGRQKPQQIFFETEAQFADHIAEDYDAFLLACAIPAACAGIREIVVDGPICPYLCDGVVTALQTLRRWYGQPSRIPAIVADGFRVRSPVPAARTGMMLSGGIDSLATLRGNRLRLPLDHPHAIRDGFLLEGFDLGGFGQGPVDVFTRAKASLEPVAAQANLTLIPVRTNLIELNRDVQFWMHHWHGAVLASVGHLFSRRISRLLIASSHDAESLLPWGSHPLLDTNYGSAALTVVHDGSRYSRLEKVACVADWEPALANLRVCTSPPPSGLNCGACEKCLRTMTALAAIGKLDARPAFPSRHVDPDLLRPFPLRKLYLFYQYRELIDPLLAQGQFDLAAAVRQKVQCYGPLLRHAQDGTWESAVRQSIARIEQRFAAVERLLMVDDEALADYWTAAVPRRFLDGEYGYMGPPKDAHQAIAELERARRAGAEAIVIAWPAFWWLDYYHAFAEYLKEKFTKITETSDFIAFDLRTSPQQDEESAVASVEKVSIYG